MASHRRIRISDDSEPVSENAAQTQHILEDMLAEVVRAKQILALELEEFDDMPDPDLLN